MKVLQIVPWFLSFALAAGCSTLPFDAGQIKEERPYPEGVWLGPRDVDQFEAALIAEEKKDDSSRMRSWRRLKNQISEGDELWEFAASPYVVDGGPRYFGVALIRDGKIVASVVTTIIE